ncbi:M20 family metallo-hydrolase [Echinicola vietnamensis]|uniref:Acetylornithine deacetylase/succinyldiaminopimelate desuccinylase-like deacylase n=1 Tax=Echinicola vietnamensis (strain DSM 17526 / LMG 23754 / KMM 6221) TaxID=926556 RepID=L0G443_ECHVK|nr:M20 family metallo-hydrolase [Echinicola vietnamensis]AGA80063.1 acetylornithine deacetylase/succinyldiaminopimelate desuccinylase-like deacylase [Echinicola vietnamensis DSM 17526]
MLQTFSNAMQQLKAEAKELLKQLIETPSLSREEDHTAKLLEEYLTSKGIPAKRLQNNVWATNKHFDPNLPNVLLNSHHDTVKPNNGYTKDPFKAIEEEGKLYGLGSNDAGGCLVSLIAAFVHLYDQKLPFNLILAATAEEEVSGKNGIALLLEELPTIALAIVGEPTLLDVAVAEKGLMVIDATVTGKAGHAARNEGINALYEALPDLNTLKDYSFKRVSEYLGESKVSATIIQAGSQHNVVPDKCVYTLDVRVTDSYTLQEALDELKGFLKADLQPRSMRLNSSALPKGHRIWEVIHQLSLKCYGSPTLSDQALIPYPSIKIGPGDSARSHTPDEFIHLKEIDQGIDRYVDILNGYADLTN